MKWIKKIFGFKTPEEKLATQIEKEQHLVFTAQRKGDLETAGKHQKRVEELIAQLSQLELKQGE
jgi:hypothetical protein